MSGGVMMPDDIDEKQANQFRKYSILNIQQQVRLIICHLSTNALNLSTFTSRKKMVSKWPVNSKVLQEKEGQIQKHLHNGC